MKTPEARHLEPMLLLFVVSGCAALIYEIVWFQVLELVIGASAISLAVLLATFMGGMSAGSLLLPRFVSTAWHPLRVYATLEALIGVAGLLLIVVMPLVGQLYTALDGGGPGSILLRALASAALLFPPTMLMGATLPAISRYVKATPRGVAWLGFLYGANILGAVAGCFLAGFYLLGAYDLTTAALVAVALNGAAAAGASLLSQRAPYVPVSISGGSGGSDRSEPRVVYVAIALSGFTALAAQVVWTRLLSLLFGATVYAFSIILAVFLAGLGLGTSIGSAIVRSQAAPRAALGQVQIGLAFAIAYGAWMVAGQLPNWPVDPALAPSVWFNFQIDFARALVAMLPATVLWGASFPLAVAAANPNLDTGAVVGRVYAANTLGAIGGSLAALACVPLIGTHGTGQMLVLLSILSGSLLIVPLVPKLRRARVLVFGVLLVGALGAVTGIEPVDPGLVAWGRQLPWQGPPNALYVGEGLNASVAVTEDFNGWRNFHVSGKVEASTEPQDMRLQRLLGHLTGLMHEDGPRSVLVVGFGAGTTAGALSIHPSVERMVICELEPLIPNVVSDYFSDVNYDVRENPKIEIVYDDARHYMLTGRETFDVITSDPIHPWVKGAATLYTKEYFQHVKARLNPGGVVTQWVPLYETTEDAVRSVVATFFEVFPNGTLWRNDAGGRGYDMVLAGRPDDTPIDVDQWQTRIDSPAYREVKTSLGEVGYSTALDLLASYSGRTADLAGWIAGAEINTDGNLRLQYLAGVGFNNNLGTQIRDSMLAWLTFPSDLFSGAPATIEALRALISSN